MGTFLFGKNGSKWPRKANIQQRVCLKQTDKELNDWEIKGSLATKTFYQQQRVHVIVEVSNGFWAKAQTLVVWWKAKREEREQSDSVILVRFGIKWGLCSSLFEDFIFQAGLGLNLGSKLGFLKMNWTPDVILSRKSKSFHMYTLEMKRIPLRNDFQKAFRSNHHTVHVPRRFVFKISMMNLHLNLKDQCGFVIGLKKLFILMTSFH